jgi:Cu(I)/Ag(I) efflux system membrane protein CusA/SilA
VTIEGRQRFPVRVRYAKQFRDTPDALGQIPVAIPNGGTVPLSEVADIRSVEGPTMIQSSTSAVMAATVTFRMNLGSI